jgi:hypothetical protein
MKTRIRHHRLLKPHCKVLIAAGYAVIHPPEPITSGTALHPYIISIVTILSPPEVVTNCCDYYSQLSSILAIA